jgi:hypothetical protein
MDAESGVPPGIDLGRHADLVGRGHYWWWRRLALVVIGIIPVVGLLNVFGQRAETTSATTDRASLLVRSPAHVRGGLMFTSEVVVTPHQDIHDGQLYFDNGWFRNMTLNGVTPQPSSDKAQGNWQVWDFGPMPSRQPFTVVISWQANPTNVGSHPQTLELYDGKTLIMTLHRTLLVFP